MHSGGAEHGAGEGDEGGHREDGHGDSQIQFIVMPSRKNPDETYRDIVHPINASFRAKLEGAVIEAYEKALAEAELYEGDDTEEGAASEVL